MPPSVSQYQIYQPSPRYFAVRPNDARAGEAAISSPASGGRLAGEIEFQAEPRQVAEPTATVSRLQPRSRQYFELGHQQLIP